MRKHFGGVPVLLDVGTAWRLLGDPGPVETLGARLAAGTTLVLRVGRGRRTRYYVSAADVLAIAGRDAGAA